MRRRPKPQLDALAVPANLARYDRSEWPGVSEYDSWHRWFEARGEWTLEHDLMGDVLDINAAMELQPVWTAADIKRMV